MNIDEQILGELQNIRRELTSIRQLTSQFVNATVEAEAEVPERMRRFAMYMHDVHDMLSMYRETGHEAPPHVKDEANRCDDRYRQILNDLYKDAGTFEKIRREMAEDPENRWDHTRQLTKRSRTDEARPSESKHNGAKDGTQVESGQ